MIASSVYFRRFSQFGPKQSEVGPITTIADWIQDIGKNVEFFTMTAGLYVMAFCWFPSVFKIKRYGVKNFLLGTFCLIYGLAIPGLLSMWTKPLLDSGNETAAYFLLLLFPITALVPGFCASLLPSTIAVKKKVAHPRWVFGLNVATLFIPAWPLWLPLLIWACWQAHQTLPADNMPIKQKKKKV